MQWVVSLCVRVLTVMITAVARWFGWGLRVKCPGSFVCVFLGGLKPCWGEVEVGGKE